MTKSPTELGSQVKLEAADQARLSQLAAREKALGLMTQNFQQAFEERAAALQQDTQLAWREIGSKYELDMTSVLYSAAQDFSTLTAVQLRLPQQGADISGV